MAKQSIAEANTLYVQRTPFQKFCIDFVKNWQLHLLMIIPVVYIVLFEYLPMFGLQIAFRDYTPKAGIIGSQWVGLGKFQQFFNDRNWTLYLWNTFRISFYSIIAGFPVPIILALIIHVNENKTLKKVVQNVSYVPHFFSVIVLVGILNRIFDPWTGLIKAAYTLMGQATAPNLLQDPGAFDHMYVWSGVWQGMGWGAIIYLSSLSSVSPELHEAARIDGASRWKRVLHVDLPAILPMISIQLILRMGSVISVGYEKIYLMQNNFNTYKSTVISLYVYKKGLGEDMSFGAAVGLMNAVVNTSMVVFVNWIANTLSDGEAGLF